MKVSKRLQYLLNCLDSPLVRKHASAVTAEGVLYILEHGHIHLWPTYPEYPGSRSKRGRVVFPSKEGQEIHEIQINLDPSRNLKYHSCVTCKGYCNASTAVLITELIKMEPKNPDERDSKADPTVCPVCSKQLEGIEIEEDELPPAFLDADDYEDLIKTHHMLEMER